MIITNDFVMLNFPKTGSSFARKVIKEIYSGRSSKFHRILANLGIYNSSFLELMLPKIDTTSLMGLKGQHGTLRQIPAQHNAKPVITITRNPFSRYVSTYLFKWWEKYPPANIDIILDQFPNFPNLTFPEYYLMMHTHGREDHLRGIVPKIDLGLYTIQFIQFYFKDPESVLREIDDNYIDNKLYENDINNIKFIRQENLNRELKEFLLHVGISEKELEFIDTMKKVNVTNKKSEDSDYKKYYSGTSIEEQILQRDRLLFEIFPDYLP